jgi:hypothetical protein
MSLETLAIEIIDDHRRGELLMLLTDIKKRCGLELRFVTEDRVVMAKIEDLVADVTVSFECINLDRWIVLARSLDEIVRAAEVRMQQHHQREMGLSFISLK